MAAAAGLVLDPWQQLVLHRAMGERPDGKWAAFEVAVIVSRQNGKGSILEARELAGLLLFGEELILHSAQEYKTSIDAFRRVKACLANLGVRVTDNLFDVGGIPVKVINTNGEEGLERLDTGQRVKFIARSKNAGRGFTADCLVWDEAYALTEDQVDAQMPTLSARPNTQIWYTSSPPLDAVTGAQLFRVRRRGLATDPGSLAYFDWGIPGQLDQLDKINLDDRQLWAAANPAYPYRISEEAIRRERDAMSDQGFARERLGVWPADLQGGFRVIHKSDWKAAADPRDTPPQLPVAFCVEVSWDQEWAAVGVAWKRADGLRQVELTRDPAGTLDHRRGTAWIVPRVKELVAAWNPCAVVVDPGGPAGFLINHLVAAGIEVETMTTRDASHAFTDFYDGISGHEIAARDVRHGNQPDVNDAVAGGLKRPLGDGFAWDRRLSSGGHEAVGAVTGALWGHTVKSPDWVAYNVLESVW